MEGNAITWEILLKSVRGALSVEEEAVLQKWLACDMRHKTYYESVCRVWSSDDTTYELQTDVDEMIVRFDDYVRSKRKARLRVIWGYVYRSVACLLILLTVGGGVLLLQKDKRRMESVNRMAGAIFPGREKAIILLSNGEKVDIDLLTDSLSYRTEGFMVEKDSGVIRYSEQRQARTDYHTIVIPRGGEYQVKLGDGTMICLNSDSRLKIPTSFAGNERRVFLSGEAYFSVMKNNDKPFIVETDLGDIKVYGTEFNVKHYSVDRQLKATLVEGVIGFSNKQVTELKLQPGYQLSLVEGESEPVVKEVKIYNE
ncbi:MAG: FecR family protein, partial [Odoribacter sp.]|nr:FecR family protein [Odoribacter sp.]